MTDFTAHISPILAVPCPDCQVNAGTMCKRPSGHSASEYHKARKSKADAIFIEQHGPDAWIDQTEDGWVIHPTGHDAEARRRQKIQQGG